MIFESSLLKNLVFNPLKNISFIIQNQIVILIFLYVREIEGEQFLFNGFTISKGGLKYFLNLCIQLLHKFN